MSWNAGYVAETTYTLGYYEMMNPANLSLNLILNGRRPVSLASFKYCELACGQGLTTNLLATMFPQGDFYANDFNPSHIASCRDMAQAISLENVTFSESSFIEYLNEKGLPDDFNFICLHGIYSWISPENQAAIIRFIRERLQVGGIVYISYNTMPGWANALPLQRFLLNQGRRIKGTIYERFQYAYNQVRKFTEAFSFHFNEPSLKARIDNLPRFNPSYLVHEYFNEHWKALYFDEVNKALQEAKLSFVSSARLINFIEETQIPKPGLDLLSQFTDMEEREQAKDYLLNTQFRTDIFVKGAKPLTPAEQIELLNDYSVHLIAPISTYSNELNLPVGKATLGDIYAKILDTIAHQPLNITTIAKKVGEDIPVVARSLVLLAGLDYVRFFLPTQVQIANRYTDYANAIANYNKIAMNNPSLPFVISPKINDVFSLDLLSKYWIQGKSTKEVAEILRMLGNSLSVTDTVEENGQKKQVMREITDEKELIALLEKKYSEFVSTWKPIYDNLQLNSLIK